MNASVGKTCPFCQMPIKPGLEVSVCSVCGIPHHSECWASNGSRCTTFGCAGAANQPPGRNLEPVTVKCPNCGAENYLNPALPAVAAGCGRCGVPIYPACFVPPAQSANNVFGPHYAGFWIRLLAYIIDFLVLAPIGAIAELIFPNEVIQAVLGLLISVIYYVTMESSSWQGTLGKRALNLIVTDEQGRRIDAGKAFARYLAKIVSTLILCIGFIMIAFSDRKQGLHDKMAGTFVLKKPN